ncbi:MAG: hypothetical protein ACI8RD_005163, partial [Bacillariaceae sp.]
FFVSNVPPPPPLLRFSDLGIEFDAE